MTVAVDPEGVSARALLDFVDLEGKRILEVGCGKGRLTFPLAEFADHITGIDPDGGEIQKAINATPEHLAGKIEFLASSIEAYELPIGSPGYDLCIFTWSL